MVLVVPCVISGFLRTVFGVAVVENVKERVLFFCILCVWSDQFKFVALFMILIYGVFKTVFF
jgi:hypothetical protein